MVGGGAAGAFVLPCVSTWAVEPFVIGSVGFAVISHASSSVAPASKVVIWDTAPASIEPPWPRPEGVVLISSGGLVTAGVAASSSGSALVATSSVASFRGLLEAFSFGCPLVVAAWISLPIVGAAERGRDVTLAASWVFLFLFSVVLAVSAVETWELSFLVVSRKMEPIIPSAAVGRLIGSR